MDVRALGRWKAARNTEQTEQRHHMVDADSAAVTEIVSEHFNEQLVAAGSQTHRVYRRQSPVLAFGREGIGWCATVRLHRQDVLKAPAIRSIPVAAQCEVVIEPDRHARRLG